MLREDMKNRKGEISLSNEGYEMRIIEYNNANDIIIEFQDKYKAKVKTRYSHFKDGDICNPYHPSIFNIGYFGEGKYTSRDEKKKKKKEYIVWQGMIKRCYDPYTLNKYPTYIDCYVCEEWHNFQNFAKWYEENYYECNNERMNLDKDILIKGNKIYSPETCVFVPQRINGLFIKQENHRGKYPIGMSEWLDKRNGHRWLKVRCSIYKGDKKYLENLGRFPLNRPFQAFTIYKNFKENYIKQVADEYKDLIPKKLYEALYKYEVEIND